MESLGLKKSELKCYRQSCTCVACLHDEASSRHIQSKRKSCESGKTSPIRLTTRPHMTEERLDEYANVLQYLALISDSYFCKLLSNVGYVTAQFPSNSRC